MKIEVVPHGDECTLLECPPGLFLFKGSLGRVDQEANKK